LKKLQSEKDAAEKACEAAVREASTLAKENLRLRSL